MRRFKHGVGFLTIATMVLMTACGKKTVTTPPLPTTTEVTSAADVITTDIITEATSETTTEASTEESSPEETTPEANSEEVTTTVKQTEAATTQATTTAKQTEAPTTVKQTEAATTAKQTEAPTTVKQTEAPTTAKQTEPATTEAATAAPIKYHAYDVVTFGNYKGYDLTWTVIFVMDYSLDNDYHILAICNNVVDRRQFNTTQNEGESVKYSDSSLKEWLENDFVNAAFSSTEKKRIKLLELPEMEIVINGLIPGIEMENVYEKCVCKPTFDLDGNSSDFWIDDIYSQGFFGEDGDYYDAESATLVKGVRPVITIRI